LRLSVLGARCFEFQKSADIRVRVFENAGWKARAPLGSIRHVLNDLKGWNNLNLDTSLPRWKTFFDCDK
jgi:hypothetical protein